VAAHLRTVVVIPGASNIAQVEANAAAADLTLTDDEVRAGALLHPRCPWSRVVGSLRSSLSEEFASTDEPRIDVYYRSEFHRN
jgi:hypothetical protein